jgi:hypothetical protein
MSPEETFIATLAAAAPVTALVGTKVYIDESPQETEAPFVVFERSDTDAMMTIHGSVAANRTTLRLGCFSETRAEAEAIANAIIAALVPAGFIIEGRAGDFDPETGAYVTVVEVSLWQ